MSVAEFNRSEFDRLDKKNVLTDGEYFQWLNHHPTMSFAEKIRLNAKKREEISRRKRATSVREWLESKK